MSRELTRNERKKIRGLVTEMCANYDSGEALCFPLDCSCYMLGKWWTGSYCRYFRESVLPLDPVLEASICDEGLPPDTKLCAVCGKPFFPEGRQAYCSKRCRDEGNRRKSRERMRKSVFVVSALLMLPVLRCMWWTVFRSMVVSILSIPMIYLQ